MAEPTPWSTPAQLLAQLRCWWERGELLAELAGATTRFPRALKLKAPRSRDLLARFEEARRWTAALQRLQGIDLRWREFRHPVFGRNALPCAASVSTVDMALTLIGRQREAKVFAELVEQTRQRRPDLLGWLQQHTLLALEHAADWPRLLDLVDWLEAHPRPGIWLRQLDLPGVHTKFVEARRRLLGALWDHALPQLSSAAGNADFATRYGFRPLPQRIRLRPLDPALALLPGATPQDLKLDLESLIALPLAPRRVVVVENEVTYLALPSLPATLAIFGAGYGIAVLGRLPWLQHAAIDYWGDIDSHGFVILDELRAVLPQTRSLLMDRDTLLAHRSCWTREPAPTRRELSHLRAGEQAVYDELRHDRLAPALRLEQELIGFGWALKGLRDGGDGD